jgi:hypothetical protein
MGPRLWESIQGPLARHQVRLPISFGRIGLLSTEDCAPFAFLRNWVLVASYLCFRFHIFNRPMLEEYVFQIKGAPYLFKSCFHVARNNLSS